VLTACAAGQLGVNVAIVKAGGVSADNLTLPPSIAAQYSAALSGAGETYAGVLSDGAASVSFATGTVSTDITVNIDGASLGALTLTAGAALPAEEASALNTLQATFPAIAGLAYTPQSMQNGYAFYATTSAEAIDPRTLSASVVAQAVMIGISRMPRGAIAYAVVGTGSFATSLIP